MLMEAINEEPLYASKINIIIKWHTDIEEKEARYSGAGCRKNHHGKY